MIEESIKGLKKEIINYALNVEKMIIKSIRGLVDKNEDVLNEVIEKDEKYANEEELKIEEMCISIIAKFEPKARHLREVVMILKINNDLERMADHAVNIAESALFLIEKPQVKPYIDLPRMADETVKMLKDSINSFIEEKPELARNVCEKDDVVDDLKDQITRELITYTLSNPAIIERTMHITKIAHNLERIADLTTNLAEDVIFIVKGEIIKHGKGD